MVEGDLHVSMILTTGYTLIIPSTFHGGVRMDGEQQFIPEKIWIYWHQGLAEAPFIVRKCVDSWVRENPSRDVVFLNSANVCNYTTLDLPQNKLSNLSLAIQSDLLRLSLLSKYGGVWADATTLCMKPLDEWLEDSCRSGFFSFYRPGPDRLLSNWFLASQKDCPIVSQLYEKLTIFWLENDFYTPSRFQEYAIKKLEKLLNRSHKTTRFWFTPIVTKLVRVYPYYVFHYMFERLVSTDPECRNIWNETIKISSDGPHAIHREGLFSKPSTHIREHITNRVSPLYKLTWKYDQRRYSPSTLLYFLLEGREEDVKTE